MLLRPGSGITLEDYTETMGETLTRHLSGQQNNTNNTNNTVTPTREQLRQQGIDEVDFQAVSISVSWMETDLIKAS